MTKSEAAAILGSIGGRSKSEAKVAAARANGLKGDPKRKAAAARKNGQKGGWPKGKRRKGKRVTVTISNAKVMALGLSLMDKKIEQSMSAACRKVASDMFNGSGRPKGKQR